MNRIFKKSPSRKTVRKSPRKTIRNSPIAKRTSKTSPRKTVRNSPIVKRTSPRRNYGYDSVRQYFVENVMHHSSNKKSWTIDLEGFTRFVKAKYFNVRTLTLYEKRPDFSHFKFRDESGNYYEILINFENHGNSLYISRVTSMRNRVKHRDYDKPAEEIYYPDGLVNQKGWFINGVIERERGKPAVITVIDNRVLGLGNNILVRKSWYSNGENYNTEEETYPYESRGRVSIN